MMPSATPPVDGVILFAHGSRDPLWRAPIEAVAARVAARSPGMLVRCAYLELTDPDLLTAARELASLGVERVRVLPMFLGTGRHAREDLPVLMDQVRTALPELTFELRPAVGEDPRLLNLIARMASE